MGTKTECINIAAAIDGANTKDRLAADMQYYLGTNYPTKKKYSILRVKRNDVIIIEYYIKLIPLSSMLKTSSPSGYKYKDRITVSKIIKMQSNKYRDVMLCILSREGAAHCVGFWNLLETGGIRTFLQLSKEQSVDAYFCCLIDSNSTDIDTIEVELVVNRDTMKNKVKSLWRYDRNVMAPNQQQPPPVPHYTQPEPPRYSPFTHCFTHCIPPQCPQ